MTYAEAAESGHAACCQQLAPHAGAAEPLQAAPEVPEAQSRPGDAGKPEGLAGCSQVQAPAACGSCALAVQAPAESQATCIPQVGNAYPVRLSAAIVHFLCGVLPSWLWVSCFPLDQHHEQC